MRVLILGVNGFIGSRLVQTILERTDWQVAGLDLARDRLDDCLDDPRFEFIQGDITINREWVELEVFRCDVVVPLVAIATPMSYVKDPLEVFRITFEENLRIVKLCAKHGKRLVFPSTSEVYGMGSEVPFREDSSELVLGPIDKQRWIYACSKQLLDRVIWAHGQEGAFDFTLFRPFNWIGPGLDGLNAAKEGSSRVVTQFIGDLLEAQPIRLVDGGRQTRCFTYIDDGIDCLMRILVNRHGVANGRIFNVGHPGNECSMAELARRLLTLFRAHPQHANDRRYSEIVEISAAAFYGPGYQDIVTRVPCIDEARHLLGWEPRVNLDTALARTLEACLAIATPVAT